MQRLAVLHTAKFSVADTVHWCQCVCNRCLLGSIRHSGSIRCGFKYLFEIKVHQIPCSGLGFFVCKYIKSLSKRNVEVCLMSFMEFIDFTSSCGSLLRDRNICENILVDLRIGKALTCCSKKRDLVFEVLIESCSCILLCLILGIFGV